MCKLCGLTRCHSACPNFCPDYTPAVCPCCREHIAVGDEVINTPQGIYHAECFRYELSPIEALAAFGIEAPPVLLYQ